MAKKKGISFIKLFLSGAVWSALYLGVIMKILGWFMDFNFLSLSDWKERLRLFLEYKWRIDTGHDFLLLFLMIVWIPFLFYGWRYVYRINWAKLKPTPRKKKIVKKVFELNESRPLYHMPRKMPSNIQAKRYVAPKLPNQPDEVVSGSKSHTNLVQMIRLIATLAKKYKVEIFQHILLEGNRVPMAISTDARAVLIEIVNKKNVNWSVEFTDDVTQGSWYSEGGVMDRLAQDLIRASASLAKSEPNSEILSAIIVTDGRILNTKQAVEYFKSKGIFLIGYNNAEPKAELPDLASFLSAYFDLKEGETDPAPQPVEKVPIHQKQQETEQNDDDDSMDESDEEETFDVGDEEDTDESEDEENNTDEIVEDEIVEEDDDTEEKDNRIELDGESESKPEPEQQEEPEASTPEVSVKKDVSSSSTMPRKIRAPLPSLKQGKPQIKPVSDNNE